MSSIIKGGRIREEMTINLDKRQHIENIDRPGITDIANNSLGVLEEPANNVDKILEEAYEQAEIILQKARQEAQEMIRAACSNAEQEAIKSEKKAKQILEEAEQQKLVLINQAKDEAALILEEASRQRQYQIESAEEEVIQMVIKLVQHIISEEVIQRVDWVRCLVRKIIAKESLKQNIDVFVSSNVFDKMSPEEIEMLSDDKLKVSLKTDTTLNDTTLLVVTDQGNIEYDILEGLSKVIEDIKTIQSLE